jgi:hypothetical protein
MKFYTTMPKTLKPYFKEEMLFAKKALTDKKYTECWRHLERAHVLAQPFPLEHTTVHWKMLDFGVRIKNIREVLSQLPRILFGGVKSFVGKIPVGNTGGANIPPLQPMAIPDDLQKIINTHHITQT